MKEGKSEEKKNKLNWLYVKRLVLPLVALAVILILVSFASVHQGELCCKKINVCIKDQEQHQFINRETVVAIASRGREDYLLGEKIDAINLNDIEQRLRQNSFVKDVQTYFDMSGKLHIDLSQRTPVLRVLSPDGNAYYLDEAGKRMPLSSHYTAFVPIATAGFSPAEGSKDSVLKLMDSSLFVLANYLKNDTFVSALCGQIIIEPGCEFTLIPRMGKFEIFLGDAGDLEDKFIRLKSFYRATLPVVGWSTYKRIVLKYKNQIIANR